MPRYAVLAAIGLVAGSAWAQQPGAEAQPAKAVMPMEEPHPGDRWVYEIRDEITGKTTATRENIVTEVTPTAISVRSRKLDANNNEEGFTVYDRSWNVVPGDTRPTMVVAFDRLSKSEKRGRCKPTTSTAPTAMSGGDRGLRRSSERKALPPKPAPSIHSRSKPVLQERTSRTRPSRTRSYH
jgi:hypothetical protein